MQLRNNLEMNSTPEKASIKATTRHRLSFAKISRNVIIVFILSLIGLFGLSMTSKRPTNLGVNDGRLATCPETPNCVSTQATDPEKKIDPMPFNGPPSETISKIKETVALNWPRASLISETKHYLHYEFKSLIFRFIDDVEFFLDDKSSVVQFRSASRVGHSDLGINRKRMIQIVESLKP